jgi:lipoprotein-anchoring transpeptidase ErfK/SrfK
MTFGSFFGRILIDQSDHLLTLYRPGKPTLTYGVAVGTAEFPTPNGDFNIISMIEDPTWVPPDSDWASGLLPVPPGPDNPLGTRWMGISSPGIGIHGTPDPRSIGYSASHGCIRMRIPDAEALFDMVQVGMRVQIQP